MRKVKALPSAGSTGDEVIWDGRVYQKSSSGRWSALHHPHFRLQVKKLYVDEGLSLRTVAERLSLPGHPKISLSQVQRVCNEEGWMRSHYGRGRNQELYVQKHRAKLKKAIYEYGLTIRQLGDALGINREYLVGELGTTQRTPAVCARARGMHAQLLAKQVGTWNSHLALDVQAMSYAQYQRAVRTMTELVLRKHVDMFDLSKRGTAVGATQVDHRVSLFHGYWSRGSNALGDRTKRKRVVPLTLICHPANLQVVPAKDNLAKRAASDFTTKHLERKVSSSNIVIDYIDPMEWVRTVLCKLNLKPLQ